jgi:hypothetical protein
VGVSLLKNKGLRFSLSPLLLSLYLGWAISPRCKEKPLESLQTISPAFKTNKEHPILYKEEFRGKRTQRNSQLFVVDPFP